MNRKTPRRWLIASTIVIILVALIVSGIFIYKKLHSNKIPASHSIETAQQSTPNTDQTSQPANQPTTAQTTAPAPAAAVPPPKPPTFTKSSGNTGSIPSGVTVDFTCLSEVNTTCSIILVANGKQTILGPSKVADNSRGQYFTDFYWTSVKGSYQITAQAKNSQGGISTSAAQSLVVQ